MQGVLMFGSRGIAGFLRQLAKRRDARFCRYFVNLKEASS
jgi:hypothetical protein